MDLLTAVNTVLPYLAEHKVTSVEGSKHPVVDLIVDSLERGRKTLLAEGKYFNSIEDLTLQPDTNSKIAVPADTLEVYGEDSAIVIRGGYLFDVTNNTWFFTKAIEVRLIKDFSFEELPYYAAAYLTYKAAYEVYVSSFGVDNTSGALMGLSEENRRLLSQQELRNRNYNSRYANRNSYAYRFLRR